jgi:hypothetical protein
LSFSFSVLASEFEFAISLGEDLEVAAGEPISWGNIADGRVQPHPVVMVNEALDKSSAILRESGQPGLRQSTRCSRRIAIFCSGLKKVG